MCARRGGWRVQATGRHWFACWRWALSALAAQAHALQATAQGAARQGLARGACRAPPDPHSRPAPLPPPPQAALASTTIVTPRIPVISNVDAQPHSDPETIKKILVQQLTSPVQVG
jgi:malonyl CoA-acyl carrier protein transacylase